jgi:hypothetical protein
MGQTASSWQNTTAAHFGFLAAHGFDTVVVDDSSIWSVWVCYLSRTAAVQVSKSAEFVRTEVSLIRLHGGEVPPHTVWITDERLDWALLDVVAEVRRPDLLAEVRRQRGLSPSQVQSQLAFWAQLLRDVAPDFLAGDFSPLDQAEELTRRRLLEHPQAVTVYLPSDAAAGADAREAEATAADVPPNVEVQVRRYKRRTAPGRKRL